MNIFANKVKSQSHKPKSLSQRIVFTVAFIVILAYSLLMLYFFVFAFLISTKYNQNDYLDDLLAARLFSWPRQFTLRNYLSVIQTWKEIDGQNTYLDMLWNSIWRSFGHTAINWFTGACVCYVMVHYKSKFTEFLYWFGLLIAMMPLYGSGGATYKLYSDINWINNPISLIGAAGLYCGNFFFMYAFWQGISHSYAEAAQIDGANEYQILFSVMLPQVLPAISALFVMAFIGQWNDYEGTAVYMNEYPNLAYGVYAYGEISKYASNTPGFYAGVLMGMVPIVVLFLCFQNTIMEKMYLGGLKG